MIIIEKLRYILSKIVYKIQIPSCKKCVFAAHVKVLPRTNLLNVNVGKYTYIGANNSMQDVEIGSFCSIGSYVAIGGGVHPMDIVSTSPVFYDSSNCFGVESFLLKNNEACSRLITRIGNDVWIGDKAYIRAGVTIGNGAVIGAGTIVTKDVPPYAIVGGAPARVIRYRFDEDVIADLQKSQWWNLSDAKLKTYSQYMANPKLFCKLLN